MKEIILAHSELTNTIYALIGKDKIDITEQAIAEVKAIKALEQEPWDDMEREYEKAKALFSKVVKSDDAISTQEPKMVLYSGDGYADGYMVYDMAECPNCGYKYEDGDKDWEEPFCPHCGQALEWESED